MKNIVLKELGKLLLFASLFSPFLLSTRAEARGFWGNWNVVRAGNQILMGNYGYAEQLLQNRSYFHWGGYAAAAERALDNGHPWRAEYDIQRAEQFYRSTH